MRKTSKVKKTESRGTWGRHRALSEDKVPFPALSKFQEHQGRPYTWVVAQSIEPYWLLAGSTTYLAARE